MKAINLNDCPEIFRGCALPGRRMSDELLALFDVTPGRLLRARCSSGVRLAFATDSPVLEYALEFGEPVRKVFTTGFRIDGERRVVDGAGPHRLDLPPSEKTVVVHLPHLVELRKIELKIADGASFRTIPETRKRILFCGDSILQGMTTTAPDLAPAARTAEALNADLLNTSVGGACVDPEHVRLTAALGGDVLVVALGVNDASVHTDLGLFRRNAAGAAKNLADFSGGKLLVLPIPNVSGSTPELDVYRNILREEAAKYPRIPVLDGYGFFPADPALYCDGIHPNDAGAKVYAEALISRLKEMF